MQKNNILKVLSSLVIKPVKVYSNANLQRKDIIRETKGLTGIYI
jgi:hypothetical protein